VAVRIKALRDADPATVRPFPRIWSPPRERLGSHISPAAAEYQVARVARAQSLDPQKVRALVAEATEGRQLGFFGEPRVNVPQAHLALEALR